MKGTYCKFALGLLFSTTVWAGSVPVAADSESGDVQKGFL